jgi:hypothetical protein
VDENDRKELIERWKLAHAEYRAEVALGWDRQKLFLTVNPALTALMASSAHTGIGARLGLVAAALTALAGVLVVRRSHGRYRATRTALQSLEDALGIQDLQTTGGQREARGEPRLERFRVVDVVAGLFLTLAALDIALAVLWR